MTKISIIVPVFNTGMYLEHCLNSIRRQTLKDIEVIVVDDGSTDNSPIICENYIEDARFKVFHNSNKGVSATRNFGIEQSTGKYCMFVDSDDWLDETMCEDMWNEACRTNADLVMCGNYNESTSSTILRHLYKESIVFSEQRYLEEIAVHTLGLVGKNIKNPSKLDKLTPVWARLYRASIIKENNIKYIDLHKLPSECLQFNFEFCVHATSACYLNKVLYHYRRNTVQSVTKPYRTDLMGKWLWWIEYEKNLIKQRSLPKDFLIAYYSRICCSVIPLGGNAIKLKSLADRLNECKLFLQNPVYKEAFNNFYYSVCPIYWKLFFWSAKSENTMLFYLMTKAMRKILEKRKK